LKEELQVQVNNDIELYKQEFEFLYEDEIKCKYETELNEQKEQLLKNTNVQIEKISKEQRVRVQEECNAISNIDNDIQDSIKKLEKDLVKEYEDQKRDIEKNEALILKMHKENLAGQRNKLKELSEEDKVISHKTPTHTSKRKDYEKIKQDLLQKHKGDMNEVEKEYNIKLKFLPEEKLLDSDKFRAELEIEESLRELKKKSNEQIMNYTNELERQEEDLKIKIERDNTKSQHLQDTDKLIQELQEKYMQVKNDMQELLKILKEINTLKTEASELEDIIEKAKDELKIPSINMNKLENQLKELLKEYNEIQESFSNTGEIDLYSGTMRGLQQELRDKEYELKQLKKELDEFIKRTASLNEKKMFATINKPMNVMASRVESESEEIPLNKNLVRVKEIVVFVKAEKTRLEIQRKSVINNFDLSTKLFKSLQSNLSQWNSELNKHDVERTYRQMIGSLKDGLDNQSAILSQQIDKLKYFSL